MAQSSPLESIDEDQLLQAALQNPFEPTTAIPLSPASTTLPSPAPSTPAPPPKPTLSEAPPTEDDWQEAYSTQVSEWRAQSASARNKAEHTRAKWEAMRAREKVVEHQAPGQPPESWDGLGAHIAASTAAASETISHTLSASVTSLSLVEHAGSLGQPGESAENALQNGKAETGSPSQRWEHISSSPTSSYPSMSFPEEASLPQSPSPQPALLAPTSAPAPAQTHPHPKADQNATYVPPSTLPSIMDNKVARRTRLSLALSSLGINLLLPFVNGVMLGFGEIFARNVLFGWFGWKTWRGSTAAGLGLQR